MSELISQGIAAKACFADVNDSRGKGKCFQNDGVYVCILCATRACPLVISHKCCDVCDAEL